MRRRRTRSQELELLSKASIDRLPPHDPRATNDLWDFENEDRPGWTLAGELAHIDWEAPAAHLNQLRQREAQG